MRSDRFEYAWKSFATASVRWARGRAEPNYQAPRCNKSSLGGISLGKFPPFALAVSAGFYA